MALFSTLQDDFQSGTIDSGRWPVQSAAVSGGQVLLTGSSLTYIESAHTYTITNSSIYFRLITAPKDWAPFGGYLTFGVYKDSFNFYAVRIYAPGNATYPAGSGEIMSCTAATTTTTPWVYSASGDVSDASLWNKIEHDGTRFTHWTSQNFTNGAAAFTQPANPGWAPTNTMYFRVEAVGIGGGAAFIDNININAALGPDNFVVVSTGSDTDAVGAVGVFPPPIAPTAVADPGTFGTTLVAQANVLYPRSIAGTDTVGAAVVTSNGVIPSGIAGLDTVGAATVASNGVVPASIAGSDTVGTVTVIPPPQVAPGGIAGSDTVGVPNVAPNGVAPNTLADTDALGAPDVSIVAFLQLAPGTIADTDVAGVGAVIPPPQVAPAAITDADNVAVAGVIPPAQVAPAAVGTDADVVAVPKVTSNGVVPDGVADTSLIGAAGVTSNGVAPGAITDTDTFGAFRVDSLGVAPVTAADTDRAGSPAASNTPSANYGADIYGRFNYGGISNTVAPIGVGNSENVLTGQGAAGNGTVVGYGSGVYGVDIYGTTGSPTSVAPNTTADIDTVGGIGGSAAGSGYGSGIYGDSVYNGSTGVITPGTVNDLDQVYGNDTDGAYGYGPYGAGPYQKRGIGTPISTGYGSGDYGAGIYQGASIAPLGSPAVPPIPPIIQVVANPLHVLGIGPWNPIKVWHGAINYGIGKGLAPAKPVMQLPGVQSKQVTLRLDGGDEATVSCQFARTDAVVVQEMATDLWWLRKDTRTDRLESLGQFNCSGNDLALATDGTLTSSMQFQDWKIVLGNRMVLKYLDTVHAESQWNSGTPITEIMKFAVPTDTGVDLSVLDDDTLLGKTTKAFTLPPYNTIADTFAALHAHSEKPWEWWVQTSTTFGIAPKLMFADERGTDRGVTLVDYGIGTSPIAAWTMRRTADTYANTLYFQGGGAAGTTGGGIIRQIAAAVAEFGERDAQMSDNSVVFNKDGAGKITNTGAADKALAAMADTRPTFTLTLRNGFWRGREHIDVGDTIRLRIRLGKEDISYTYRTAEIQLDVDSAGTETVTLTLGAPLASANPRSRYSPTFRLVRALKNYAAPAGYSDS